MTDTTEIPRGFRQDAVSTAEFASPMAAGLYWVGDPCYAFDDATAPTAWSDWLDDAWKDLNPNALRILDGRANGARVVASGTAYGDGEYPSNIGAEFPVDAGLIGVVHVDHWMAAKFRSFALGNAEAPEPFGMTAVLFEKPFHVSYEDGTITIGHVEVYTDDTPDGFEYEDEDED